MRPPNDPNSVSRWIIRGDARTGVPDREVSMSSAQIDEYDAMWGKIGVGCALGPAVIMIGGMAIVGAAALGAGIVQGIGQAANAFIHSWAVLPSAAIVTVLTTAGIISSIHERKIKEAAERLELESDRLKTIGRDLAIEEQEAGHNMALTLDEEFDCVETLEAYKEQWEKFEKERELDYETWSIGTSLALAEHQQGFTTPQTPTEEIRVTQEYEREVQARQKREDYLDVLSAELADVLDPDGNNSAKERAAIEHGIYLHYEEVLATCPDSKDLSPEAREKVVQNFTGTLARDAQKANVPLARFCHTWVANNLSIEPQLNCPLLTRQIKPPSGS